MFRLVGEVFYFKFEYGYTENSIRLGESRACFNQLFYDCWYCIYTDKLWILAVWENGFS